MDLARNTMGSVRTGTSTATDTALFSFAVLDCPFQLTNANECLLYGGNMTIYLQEGANPEEVTLLVRKLIRELSNNWSGSSGVIRAKYLGPTEGDETDQNSFQFETGAGDSETLNTSVVTIVALSSFVLILGMVAAYRYRRTGRDGKDEGVLTLAAGSDLTPVDSNLSDATSSNKSFSGMMPLAYRTDHEIDLSGMSAILEGDSDSQSNGSDIYLSEAGYSHSEDDSISQQSESKFSRMQSLSNHPVLGAQKMVEDDEEDDFLFDTGASQAKAASMSKQQAE
jgi:hypothetical protein